MRKRALVCESRHADDIIMVEFAAYLKGGPSNANQMLQRWAELERADKKTGADARWVEVEQNNANTTAKAQIYRGVLNTWRGRRLEGRKKYTSRQ